jgi:predicted NAD-dependent protein-ADP-ribosyltransferase YbiA (DUF1768 family)
MEASKKIMDERVVNFYSRKKEYRSLSNFWENDVTIVDGGETRIYQSGEHCFHGEKYRRISAFSENDTRKRVLNDYSKSFLKPSVYATPGEAKKAGGGKHGLNLLSDELKVWSQLSVDVQKEICGWKIKNNETVKQDLLKSGTRLLVHPALMCSEAKLRDRIWEGRALINERGELIILGQNLLGNIWMDKRDEVVKQERDAFIQKERDNFTQHKEKVLL